MIVGLDTYTRRRGMAVITISRQFGSGGRQVAARVCELLGYSYLDKLLMTQVAAEAGLSGKELADYSEERRTVRNFLDRLFRPGPHDFVRVSVRSQDVSGAETITVKYLDETRSANLIRSAILRAYERGNVVIVGRGGQATLQQMAGVLHVRLEAAMGTRILRIQESEGINAETARQRAMQEDQASAEYLKRLFGIRWDDSTLYHLLLNTGKWDLETVAQLIVQAAAHLPAEPKA
jgi:cytidylate kinase